MRASEKFTIFYSWQSDLPAKETRNAIKASLRSTANAIEKDDESLSVIIDEATRDISGAPNIPRAILEKIEESDLFIADVSAINSGQGGRSTPNPNVVFELGFAVAVLGWSRIVLMINESFGTIGELPFDFAQHRVSKFRAKEKDQLKALDKLIRLAVGSVLESDPEKPMASNKMTEEEIKKKRDLKNLEWILSYFHLPTLDQHIQDAPYKVTDKILTFWELIRSIHENPLFHIYNPELKRRLDQVIEHLGGSLNSGSFYSDLGHYPYAFYVFSSAKDFFKSEEDEEKWNELNNEVEQLSKGLTALLDYIRTEYVSIDLEAMNDEAWKNYIDVHKSSLEALEGEE